MFQWLMKKWVFDWKAVEWAVICRDLYQHRWKMSTLIEENSHFLWSESQEVCLVMGNCSCSDSTRCCNSCVIPYNQYQSVFWMGHGRVVSTLATAVGCECACKFYGSRFEVVIHLMTKFFIIGIHPVVLMSPPHKNDIHDYIHTCTFLLKFCQLIHRKLGAQKSTGCRTQLNLAWFVWVADSGPLTRWLRLSSTHFDLPLYQLRHRAHIHTYYVIFHSHLDSNTVTATKFST